MTTKLATAYFLKTHKGKRVDPDDTSTAWELVSVLLPVPSEVKKSCYRCETAHVKPGEQYSAAIARAYGEGNVRHAEDVALVLLDWCFVPRDR